MRIFKFIFFCLLLPFSIFHCGVNPSQKKADNKTDQSANSSDQKSGESDAESDAASNANDENCTEQTQTTSLSATEIIDQKCISCHNGLYEPNLSSEQNIMTHIDSIIASVKGETTIMPPTGSLPDSEIQVLESLKNTGNLLLVQEPVTYENTIRGYFTTYCAFCHGQGDFGLLHREKVGYIKNTFANASAEISEFIRYARQGNTEKMGEMMDEELSITISKNGNVVFDDNLNLLHTAFDQDTALKSKIIADAEAWNQSKTEGTPLIDPQAADYSLADLMPLVNTQCVGCHGSGNSNTKLKIDSEENVKVLLGLIIQTLECTGENCIPMPPGAPLRAYEINAFKKVAENLTTTQADPETPASNTCQGTAP